MGASRRRWCEMSAASVDALTSKSEAAINAIKGNEGQCLRTGVALPNAKAPPHKGFTLPWGPNTFAYSTRLGEIVLSTKI